MTTALIKTGQPFWRFHIGSLWHGALVVIHAFGLVLMFRNPRYMHFEDFHGMKARGEIVRKGNRWVRA